MTTDTFVPRRVGVFGGTFDPIHNGHLLLAEQARELLGLDCVLFIPAAVPPHKQDHLVASGRNRLEMVELAVAGHPSFEASDLELERRGVSYTVDTLQRLHQREPQTIWYLLMGADAFADFATWRDPEAIVQLARLAVFRRPGAEGAFVPPADSPAATPIERLETLQFDYASREIRRRLSAGRSIRYLTPAAVEAYIQAHRLYASSETLPMK